MKTQIQLPIPILLNKLYIPNIKYVNGTNTATNTNTSK